MQGRTQIIRMEQRVQRYRRRHWKNRRSRKQKRKRSRSRNSRSPKIRTIPGRLWIIQQVNQRKLLSRPKVIRKLMKKSFRMKFTMMMKTTMTAKMAMKRSRSRMMIETRKIQKFRQRMMIRNLRRKKINIHLLRQILKTEKPSMHRTGHFLYRLLTIMEMCFPRQHLKYMETGRNCIPSEQMRRE